MNLVGALQVHHFKPDRLPAEMLLVPQKYINLDLANGGAGQAGYDAMEHSPSRHELLRLDIQLLQGVTVQDVDAAPTVYQHAEKWVARLSGARVASKTNA